MTTENRSWLFVPGDDERKLARSREAGADALIFDLEDAVLADRRVPARQLVREALAESAAGRAERWVRINPLDSPDALADLVSVVGAGLDGVVLPKIQGASEVTRLDHYLAALEAREGMAPGSVRIMVVATETPEVLFRLGDLAGSSPRLTACTWGAEDLSAAVGATTNRAEGGAWDTPYQLARSLCLFAAHAAGAQAVDTLLASLTDDAALAESTRSAARQGFTGKLAIHPRQVPIINEHMTPSAEEIAAAEAVVGAFAARSGAGAVALDGRMLDRPHLVQAERVLARAARVGRS